MTETYADHPYLQGNYAPLRMESDLNDLIVEGEIPKDLYGSYYRNGPDPQFPPMGGNYHWFGGDGMIHAFHFENGKVSYKNRWIQTSKWKQERKAGKSLVNILNPMEPDPLWNPEGEDGTANTNIIFHGDKLLALEEGHPPFEIDPFTLKSIGSHNYEGKLLSPMTAHPKIDPLTGEMFSFSYGFGDNKMTYFVVDADGKLTHYSEFTTPYSSMVHDFIVTSQHVIFPVFPLVIDLEQAMMGNAPIAWDGKRPSYIGIMPRDGSVEDIKWIEDDPCYVFHAMNAYTEGDKIVADMMQFEEAPLFPHVDGSAPDPKKAEARLNRISWNAIAHHDHRTGNKEFFVVDKEDAVGEPIFVPASRDAEEGDGFLITLAYKGKENRSDLLIFNAMDLESGPIATAHLPHRVPYGFHGNWRQGEQT